MPKAKAPLLSKLITDEEQAPLVIYGCLKCHQTHRVPLGNIGCIKCSRVSPPEKEMSEEEITELLKSLGVEVQFAEQDEENEDEEE